MSSRARALYVVLMSSASAIGLVKTLVYAKVLGVDGLGLYGLAVLVVQYGVFVANFGLFNALGVELPTLYGRLDAKVPRVESTLEPAALVDRVLGALLLISLAAGAAYLGLVLALSDGEARVALSLAVVVNLAWTFTELCLLLLRTRRQPLRMAAMYMARASLALIIGTIAGAAFGYWGAILFEAGALAVVASVAVSLWLPELRPRRPRFRESLGLVRLGAPLLVSNVLATASVTLDRVFVAGALPDQFGQYAFAAIVVTAAVAVYGMLSQVITPQMLYERGAGASIVDLRRRLLRLVALLGAGSLAGLALFFPLVAWLRDGPFTEYRAGLDIMPILYLGGALSLLALYGTLLIVLRRLYLVTLATGLGAGVGLLGGVALVAGTPTLSDFAWLYVASQAAVSVAMVIGVEATWRREAVPSAVS